MQNTSNDVMIPMFRLYSKQFMTNDPQAVTGRQGRIFMEICRPRKVTRKQLAEDFSLRPGTVSAIVLQLIERGLVKEGRPAPPYQKGRPEILLRPVTSRLGVIVFYVVSQSFHAALVDFGGNILCSQVRELQGTQVAQIKDGRLNEMFLHMIHDIRAAAPANTDVVGISFSLPGVVDELNKKWVFSWSRWKKAWNIAFSEIAEETGLSVILNKNINCELRARVDRLAEQSDKSILIIHWGHGIGVACSLNGTILTSNNGGFGEVGHTHVHCENETRCRCGLNNCLETQAALWALWPVLREKYPNVPADEWEFEKFLNDTECFDVDILNVAICRMAETMRNLALTLAPQHIVLTGPFAQHPEIFRRVCREFNALLPPESDRASHNKASVTAARAGMQDEIIGAAYPLFAQALQELR